MAALLLPGRPSPRKDCPPAFYFESSIGQVARFTRDWPGIALAALVPPMLSRDPSCAVGNRDLRIDCLRGLAMACVIVNHTRMSSVLSWFSYERFWVVTAAEVFVVLSGVVLGMVYGRRLARSGWRSVVSGLGRRALTLYAAFVIVTVSLVVLSLSGVDVGALARENDRVESWFLDPRSMEASAWRDLLLMRSGPWVFEIVALYVWLVVAAVPCLLALRFVGWRPLVAASWIAYLFYRMAPRQLSGAEFESVFPILAWQLLFVHGITIGYHRQRISTWIADRSRLALLAAGSASTAFIAFALCNPWVEGPSWLHWQIVSADRFSELYTHYFGLSELGIGRLLNLAVALPMGYALLGWCWAVVRPFQSLLVTLGQRSLGAFVLHVYGTLLLAHLPHAGGVMTNTMLQLLVIVGIAALLNGGRRARVLGGSPAMTPSHALAA
jgi:hypothetical protein